MAEYEQRGPQPAASYAPTYAATTTTAPAPAVSLQELALDRLHAIEAIVDRIALSLSALPADPSARGVMLTALEEQVTALASHPTFASVSVRTGVGDVANLRDRLAQRIAEMQIRIADARAPEAKPGPEVATASTESDPLAGVSDEHRAAATYLHTRSNLAWQALESEKSTLVWPAPGFGVTWPSGGSDPPWSSRCSRIRMGSTRATASRLNPRTEGDSGDST